MKLYARTNSERATKEQGSNKYLITKLLGEARKGEYVTLGEIQVTYKEDKDFITYYVDVYHAKAEEPAYTIALPVPTKRKGEK